MGIRSRFAARSALLGSAAFLASSFTAAAQEQPAAAEKDQKVERVVVTAQKKSESIRDVPMGVTALTEEDLGRLRATSFSDYVALVPGMSSSEPEPGHTVLTIRGLNAGGVAANVGTYLDETPWGSSSGLANGTNKTPNIDTFDIQRIEVLRGPQGTLYGANSIGGLLKFVTNKPDTHDFDNAFEFGGSTVADGGSGGFAKGMLNVPLFDSAAIRAVGYYRNDPGYIDDPGRGLEDINDVETIGGRATFLFEPSDNFSLSLTAIAQNLEAGANSVVDISTAALPNFVPLFGDLVQQRADVTPSEVRYRIYNGTLNWDWGWAELTSATSWASHDEFQTTDGTGVFGLFIDARLGIDRFTQEVRLASPQDDRALEWLFGVYYNDEDAILHQGLALTPGGAELAFVQLDSQFSETAVFANFTYHFSPAFDVNLGGRYSTNEQSARQFGLASAGPASSSEEVFTYSFSPRWHVSKDTMIYGRIASGYRPGGPNALPPPPPAPPPGSESFNSDTNVNYELGVKTDVLDGRLQLDFDVYFIEWSDIQLLTVVNNFGFNINGGTAESKGVEFSAAWSPTDQLTVRANAAYTNAELTSDAPAAVRGKAGDPLPLVPEWSGALDVDYRFDSVGLFEPFIGGGWRYYGERQSGFDAVPGIPVIRGLPLEAYSTFDLRAGVVHGAWTLQLYAKNVSDERGIVAFDTAGTSAASFTSPTVTVIVPRTIGIAVTGKF
jgi:iron complex outermembrane receptor protein